MQDPDVTTPQAPSAQSAPPPPVPAPAPPIPQATPPRTPAPPTVKLSAAAPAPAAPTARVLPPSVAKLTPYRTTAAPSGATRRSSSTPKGERTPLPPGTRVGSYTITSKIGIGGFGIVYAATHTQDGTQVAIKEHMPEGLAVRHAEDTFVHPSSPENEERFRATVGEFLEEVTVLMGISHPGIVPILTAFESNGTAYYVMPFQKGTSLAVAEQGSLDAAQQAQEARHNKRLLLSLLSTLDYLRMHRIVHRDIKPDNILTTEEGNTVLLDFGSARQLQPGKVFTNVFTPDFSAPEQSHAETDAEMSESLGPWTDIYSLGVCFYYLITHLYPPRSELRVISSVDPYTPLAGRADLEHLYGAAFLKAIDRALELKITDRWQNAAAWRIAIGEGMLPTPVKAKRRLPTSTLVAAAALIGFSGLSAWAWYERSLALKALDTSLTLNGDLLNDISAESIDTPGTARIQRILAQHLETYLHNLEHTPGVEDTKYLRTLSTAFCSYGDIFARQGNAEEADSAYRCAADLLRQLQKLEPENLIPPYTLVCVLLEQAKIALQLNRTKQAKQLLAEAEELIYPLCDTAPHNPDFTSALGQTLALSAQLALSENKRHSYRETLTRTLNLYRDMQNDFPDHLKAREGLGYALLSSAQDAMDQGELEQAREQLSETRQIFTALTTQRPYQLSLKNALAHTYYALGELHRLLAAAATDNEQTRLYNELALSSYRKHNELISYLDTQENKKNEYAYRLSRSLSRMVPLLLSSGQPNLAESYCKTILLKTDKLLEADPGDINYEQLAARAKRGIALAHSSLPSYAENLAEDFRQYRSAMADLHRRSPNTASMQYRYAESLWESAAHAQDLGATAEQARDWLTEAESILQPLADRHPDDTSYTAGLETISTLLQTLTQTPAPTTIPTDVDTPALSPTPGE